MSDNFAQRFDALVLKFLHKEGKTTAKCVHELDDFMFNSGCDTCDYGSGYHFTIYYSTAEHYRLNYNYYGTLAEFMWELSSLEDE